MGAVDLGVAPLNPPVLTEDEDIAALIADDPAGCLKCFLLGIEMARDPLGARLANGPPFPARHNVLSFE